MSAYYKRQVKKHLPADLLAIVNLYCNGPEDIYKKRKKLHKEITDPKYVILYTTDRELNYRYMVCRVLIRRFINVVRMKVEMHEKEICRDEHYDIHKETYTKLKNKKARIVHHSLANQKLICL